MYTFIVTLAALTAGAAAQSTTVVTALLGDGFAASVISADPCGTTLAAVCTDTDLCPNTLALSTLTVTEGPSNFQFQYATSTAGAAGSVVESCALTGPANSATLAVCHATVAVSGNDISTSVVTSTTISSLPYGPLTVTGGVEKLKAATGTCGSTNAAAPTGAAVREVYKVIVPVGAAALMALA